MLSKWLIFNRVLLVVAR